MASTEHRAPSKRNHVRGSQGVTNVAGSRHEISASLRGKDKNNFKRINVLTKEH